MARLGWVVAGVSRGVETVTSAVFGSLALVQVVEPCSP